MLLTSLQLKIRIFHSPSLQEAVHVYSRCSISGIGMLGEKEKEKLFSETLHLVKYLVNKAIQI